MNPPGTELPTGIASGIIKARKPPYHYKAQCLHVGVILLSYLYSMTIAIQGEYLQIDLGVVRQVKHIALQGRPGSSEFVRTFYLKFGNNGRDFNSYGENATVKYKVNILANTPFLLLFFLSFLFFFPCYY